MTHRADTIAAPCAQCRSTHHAWSGQCREVVVVILDDTGNGLKPTDRYIAIWIDLYVKEIVLLYRHRASLDDKVDALSGLHIRRKVDRSNRYEIRIRFD